MLLSLLSTSVSFHSGEKKGHLEAVWFSEWEDVSREQNWRESLKESRNRKQGPAEQQRNCPREQCREREVMSDIFLGHN